jgi:nucleoside-diphosphate-sugar epimerase
VRRLAIPSTDITASTQRVVRGLGPDNRHVDLGAILVNVVAKDRSRSEGTVPRGAEAGAPKSAGYWWSRLHWIGPVAKAFGARISRATIGFVIKADFRHVDQIVQAMKGVDDVIHLGAIVGDPACALDQELTVEVNLMATRMIAEVAKGSGIRRFCFASTCSVYGANDHMLDEWSELNPISLYAQSKLASEKVLIQMADEFFSPVILRFGTVYGLSGRTRFDLVVNLLTARAIVDGKITVFGGGQWRPFLHVNDAAGALLKAVGAPTDLVHGEVFNVGSNEQNYQIGEAAQIIQSLVGLDGRFPEITDMGADTDFRNYRVDFTKITKILGFIPEWTLQEGIQQVIAALEGGDVKDYRDPMYSNVKFLSEETNSRLIRRENGWASELINDEVKSRTGPAVGAERERAVRRGKLRSGRVGSKVN